jgi:hypothetical protein
MSIRTVTVRRHDEGGDRSARKRRVTMKYVLAIYADESRLRELSESEVAAEIDAYWRLDAAAQEAGVLVDSQPLADSDDTATVKVRDGEAIVTDGPFAESKEQLGGFYLLECSTREEAIRWAARIPGAAHGHVEVRRVVEYPAPEWMNNGAAPEESAASSD